MNAVIYVRYNSHIQNEQAIESQLKVCYKYAKENNYTIISKYIDVANREQFEKMIKDSSKKEFQAIIVYSLDRFARNKYDNAIYKHQLKKNNVKVLSTKENSENNANGILMESILEAMAEYYDTQLGEKVKKRNGGLNAFIFYRKGNGKK